MNFDDKKFKKSDFYKNKQLIRIEITLMLIKYEFLKKEPHGTKNSFKYFIGYNDNDVIRPLCIKLPQIIGYVGNLKVIQQCPLRLVTNNC